MHETKLHDINKDGEKRELCVPETQSFSSDSLLVHLTVCSHTCHKSEAISYITERQGSTVQTSQAASCQLLQVMLTHSTQKHTDTSLPRLLLHIRFSLGFI